MKKRIPIYLLLILAITAINSYSRTYRFYVGRKWLYISLTPGWYRTRRTSGDIFSARRVNDRLGIQIKIIKDSFEKFLQKKELYLKYRSHNVNSSSTIYIEGIKFREYISDYLRRGIRYYSRTLVTKNGNAALIFYYHSFNKKNFLRTLNDIDIIVSGFFRKNFIDH